MPSADGGGDSPLRPAPSALLRLLPRLLAGAALAAVPFAEVAASPVRVAALGGDDRLLLDSTNLFRYPALAGSLPHVDIEIFDDWAGAVVPLSRRQAAGVFLNRPDPGTGRLAAYLRGRGSRQLRSLDPRPWLDAIYGVRLGTGAALGAGLLYAADLNEVAGSQARASRWEAKLGLAAGTGPRRLDGAVAVERVTLKDRTPAGASKGTDGTGAAVDLRGRWTLRPGVVLLSSASWERSAYGLSPETRRTTSSQLALGVNARPAPSALGVVGLRVVRERETADPGDGTARARRTLLAPGLVAGGEVQAGSILFRLGSRYEGALRETRGPTGQERTLDADLSTQVGLGFEFGAVAVDGLLEKDFLRDGPHFLGGSRRGGGLLSTLSILYRFYP